MRHLRFLPWGVAAGLCTLVVTFAFLPFASAADPDQPTGPGHHGSSALVTIGPIPNQDQGLDMQNRLHVSLAGDPDQPTGPGHGHGSSADISMIASPPAHVEWLASWRFIIQAFRQLVLS